MPFRPRALNPRVGSPANQPFLPAGFGMEDGFGDLVEGIGSVFSVLKDDQDKEDRLYAEKKYGEFVVKWTEKETERRNATLGNPTENSTYMTDTREDFEKDRQVFLESISEERGNLSKPAQNYLTSALTRFQQEQSVQSIGIEDQRNKSSITSMLTDKKDILINEVISTPELWEEKEQQMMADLASVREELGPNAVALAQTVKVEMREAHVRGVIKRDPTQALMDIHAGTFDDKLTATSKTKMIATAEREMASRNTAIDKEIIAREKAVKRFKADNYDSINVRIAQGTMTADELTDNLSKRYITSEQFNTARANMLKSNDDIGDNDTYMELRVLALKGELKLENILQVREVLNVEQEKDLTGIIDQVDRRGGDFAREDVKNDMSRIELEVGGLLGPLAKLNPDETLRVNNAMQAYRSRVLQEGSENSQQIADEIIQRFSPITTRQRIRALPSTPYWQGKRHGSQIELQEKLSRTYERLFADIESGELSAEKGSDELRILENYRTLIEQLEK